MMMMKPNNGHLQSPTGQRAGAYKLACLPLFCERKEVLQEKKPLSHDKEAGPARRRDRRNM